MSGSLTRVGATCAAVIALVVTGAVVAAPASAVGTNDGPFPRSVQTPIVGSEGVARAIRALAAGADSPADRASLGSGFGWHSLYFNKSETKDIASAGLTSLGGAVAACAKGGPVVVAACSIGAASIGATAQYAQNHKQCVGIFTSGVLPVYEWNPFAYTGVQCK